MRANDPGIHLNRNVANLFSQSRQIQDEIKAISEK
jgi:hypothetical protein